MGPKSAKHKSQPPPSPSPPRKSRRLAGLSPEPSGDRRPSTNGTLSTQPELPDNWLELKTQAASRLSAYTPSQKDDEKLTACLLAFLDWLPDGGRESLARDIVQCDTDDGLYAMFLNFRTGLLYTMKAASRTSSVVSSPIEKRRDNVNHVASALGDPVPRTPDFRASCLRRDDYRCIISGQMDMHRWEEIGSPEDVTSAYVEAAHIIPFSYASRKSTSKDASSAWEVLWRCFPPVRRTRISIDNTNDVSNGITMRSSIHQLFGKCAFAFVPTDQNHIYDLKFYRGFATSEKFFFPENNRVEIRTAPGAEDLALPDPALLDCHYRIAEILNASGMGEVIDMKINEWEDMRDLDGCGSFAPDGSTDVERLLSAGLWGSVTC